MSLPFEKVWASLVNVALLLHVEMSDDEVTKLVWFICKSIKHKDLLRLDIDLVRGSNMNRSRVMKRAQLGLLT